MCRHPTRMITGLDPVNVEHSAVETRWSRNDQSVVNDAISETQTINW